MTAIRSWLAVYALLALGVSTTWAEEKKDAKPPKAPKSCCDQMAPACTKCCCEADQCPVLSKGDKWREIERRLNAPVRSMSFKDTPLRQVLHDLQGLTGINIVPDEPALNEAGIRLDRPITIKLEGVSLKAALDLILHQADLTYTVKDGVLVVTTKQHARGKLMTKLYPVLDLVLPAKAETPAKNTNCGNACAVSNVPADRPASEETPEDALINVITRTITPQSWCWAGGEGTVDYFPLSRSLVVTQTPDVQEQVAEFLSALRRINEACAPTPVPPPPAPPIGPGFYVPSAPIFPEPMPPYAGTFPVPAPSYSGPVPPPCPSTCPVPTPTFAPPPFNVQVAPGASYAYEPQRIQAIEPPCPRPVSFDRPVKAEGSSFTLQAVNEDGKTKLEIKNSADIRLTCESVAMNLPKDIRVQVQKAPTGSLMFGISVNSDAGLTGSIVKLTAANRQIHLNGPGLEAVADRVKTTDKSGWIVLEGHVRLSLKKGNQRAEVVGEHVEFSLADGQFTIQSKAVSSGTAAR
jgi:hypothetical protein